MNKTVKSVEWRSDKWINTFIEEIKTGLKQVAFSGEEGTSGVVVREITMSKNLDAKRITVKISREDERGSE